MAAQQPGERPPSAETPPGVLTAGYPSMLWVSRLSKRPFLSAPAEALYRRIARQVELGPGTEFLLVPAARGLTTRFLSQVSGAAGVGADPNPAIADDATERGRDSGFSANVHFDTAELTDLPYQDDIFDFAMGELGLGASGDPAGAVRELVRVVKPMGTVALLQLVWTRQMEPARRESIVRMLGVRPMLLVEWKQMLREAGAVELHIEDLTAAAADPKQPLMGVAGLVDFGSLRDRFAVLVRAWRRWGWRGVREALRHGNELRNVMARERVVGLTLIRGPKWRERRAVARPEPQTTESSTDHEAEP
jgi:ubiquinone/menaquinone biosynthesis C-methylase UbiE